MATGEQLIGVLAKITGFEHSYIGRVARLLRQAGNDLWPQSGKGGGKSARHVETHHANNILLALGIGEPASLAPDRVRAFRSLVRVGDPERTTFGAALDRTLAGLVEDPLARGKLLVDRGVAAIELFPTMRAGAVLRFGQFGGEYNAPDLDALRVAGLMRQHIFGFTQICLIRPALLAHVADLLATPADQWPQSWLRFNPDFKESGASPGREAPQSTRPSDEGISETPRTDHRSLDNRDPISCASVSATPQAAGGQPSTTGAHHDEREPGRYAGYLDPDHRTLSCAA